jgi:glutathione synthase/RimK-type ligase-like ATP-grasp enzyme
MKKFALYCYNNGSQGATLLAKMLGCKKIKHEGSKFKPNANKTVINWGSGNCPYNAINVKTTDASNKLTAFKKMFNAGVSVPVFTENKNIAEQYAKGGKTVFARKLLNSHSGKGIVAFKDGDPVPDAPLYVEYIPKKFEFRVHIMKGKVIHVQQKKLKTGHAPHQVRNLDNGYIFAINDIEVPASVITEAGAAVQALGLDFGAVDIVYNEKHQKAYVLEVNTAPGLCDTTAKIYAEAFNELCA